MSTKPTKTTDPRNNPKILTIRNPFTTEHRRREEQQREQEKQEHLQYLKWMKSCKDAYEDMIKLEQEEEKKEAIEEESSSKEDIIWPTEKEKEEIREFTQKEMKRCQMILIPKPAPDS